MNSRKLALGLLCALALPSVALADTFTTFNINATLTSGTVSGTVTLDETTGNFTASNIMATNAGVNYLFTGPPVLTDVEPLYDRVHFADTAIPGSIFGLDFITSSPIGYTGGALCSTSTPCVGTGPEAGTTVKGGLGTGTSTNIDPIAAGTLTPTPEPSSLILLGTGALSLAATARRRIRRP